VSGKGIPAALFMAVTMTLLRSLAREGHAPEEIVRRLNDELLEQNPRGMFVTLQCLLFDLAARTVTCASAGHHAAIRVTPAGTAEPVFTSSGRVLALMPAQSLASETIDLRNGETLVLFTDGVSEAFSVSDEPFGDDRLIALLQATPGSNAKETSLGILDAVRRHAAGAKQSDDITVMSVRCIGDA
jgi:sigma-B regulation protein RsbU (phosphoserine phosphatase)